MSYLEISHAIECLKYAVSKGDRKWLYKKIYNAYCVAHPIMRFFPKSITWYIVIFWKSFRFWRSRIKNSSLANVF